MSKKLESKIKENGFKYGFNSGIIYSLDCKDVCKFIWDYPHSIREIIKGPKRREKMGMFAGKTINASIGYGLPLLATGAVAGYTYLQMSQ